jgi:hypothetical protein
MRNTGLRSHFTSAFSLGLAIAGLVAVALPSEAFTSSRSRTNPRASDYRSCTSGLTGAGLASLDAANACADALYPRDLERCVTRIDSNTEIAATDALENCVKVRRPVELAECVTDIDGLDGSAAGLNVLDYCRRSLLPLRFSACVVGLSNEGESTTDTALESCISAGNRPDDVLPSFIPAGEPVQLDPLEPTPLSPTPEKPIPSEPAPLEPAPLSNPPLEPTP